MQFQHCLIGLRDHSIPPIKYFGNLRQNWADSAHVSSVVSHPCQIQLRAFTQQT